MLNVVLLPLGFFVATIIFVFIGRQLYLRELDHPISGGVPQTPGWIKYVVGFCAFATLATGAYAALSLGVASLIP